MIRIAIFAGLCVLSACTETPPTSTAIIGATLVNGPQGKLPQAVVIVKEDRVTAVGTQQMTPIPAGSAKIEAYGKYLVHEDGEMKVGAKANLVILSGAPETSPKVERRMAEGRWLP